jgi:lipopolysaccharide transport system permease protein
MIDGLRELYSFRELLRALVIRELKVKYKNSFLGFFWSLLNPLLTMGVFTFMITVVFKTGVKDFSLFLLTGLLPWNLLAMSLNRATLSMIENANLIKKVYFPRETIPLSIIITNIVNFVLELIVLFVFLLAWGYNPFPFLPVLILAITLQFFFVVGLSLALSCMTVYFRDLQQLVPIGVMIWFYGTAVLYPLDMVPAYMRNVFFYINPMNSIIALYRDALYWLRWPDYHMVVYALIASLFSFSIGYAVFSRISPELAKEV